MPQQERKGAEIVNNKSPDLLIRRMEKIANGKNFRRALYNAKRGGQLETSSIVRMDPIFFFFFVFANEESLFG